MEPTLDAGQHLLVNKLRYVQLGGAVRGEASFMFGAPRRGEVVILRDPSTGGALVKRVIGLPGDSVQIVAGRVLVNGPRERPAA